MSEKKMKKDADEKSDDDGERLATAIGETRFRRVLSKDRRLSRRQTKDV
jgi:hypothetical protein